jgi:lipopolysaccharide export system permease protein
MKRIDAYLLRSFFPPFVATFFIAVFVLILQILWVYIDDIIGKGSSLLFILEMVFYLSMTLVPLALPIAVLISSVMVMGNLAERYELSSLKSAGVSLGRIMLPLMVVSSLVGVFSFISSNYLIPIANLKGKTRLYDVRKQKPNLNLEAGVFNEDFEGYVIYAGNKSTDGRHIYDVLIYTTDYSRSLQVVTADQGQLYVTPDQRYMVMELENGRQYQELEPGSNPGSHPFLRSEFRSWQKLFDLGQFNLERTDEASFRTHSTVMTISQIRMARDSILAMRAERDHSFRMQVSPYLYKEAEVSVQDSVPEEGGGFRALKELREERRVDISAMTTRAEGQVVVQDSALLAGGQASALLDTYKDKDHMLLMGRARVTARSVHGEALSVNRVKEDLDRNLAKYSLEIHLKYSLAFICVIFLFIGAPMGALVRKGGFGYPLLIAICFFMLFMILNMLFKSLAEKLIISPILGAWMPCLILLPLGLFLTHRAMIDARIIETEALTGPLARLFARLKKPHAQRMDPTDQ